MIILVAGMVAADPHQGGATWAVLQYVRGLEQLGHEVWLVDPAEAAVAGAGAYFAELGLGLVRMERQRHRMTELFTDDARSGAHV